MAEVTTSFYSRVALLMILYILHQSCVAESTLVFNVLSFGAKPNGVIDSTRAFLDVWTAACASSDSTTIRVPKGRYLLRNAMVFKANNWLSFEGVTGVSIIGGALDLTLKVPPCGHASLEAPIAPTEEPRFSLSFTNSKNININGLMSLNSQMFHIVINGCQDVRIKGVKVNAAGNSPNTDGIHVQFLNAYTLTQLSRNVAIFNTSIKTGDDCVSIGLGTKDLWMEQITCGREHGISIGNFQNVTVKNAIFKGTQNGLRIKS
ncbi:unnamed protein product [Prunus brigantina]